MRSALLVAACLLGTVARAQLAPNAPQDQPQAVQAAQMAALEKAIAPHIAKARETYPAARDRFKAGLPRGETFFVTTRLRDSAGRMEQVFIRVVKIDGDRITGSVASQIRLVAGFRPGQTYEFADTELIDWLITKPDGSEEGNVVGKFLDTYRP